MHAHPLFGEIGIWVGLLLGSALVVAVAAVAASFLAPRPKTAAREEGGEHASPPIPIVLKLLWAVIALWAAGYVAWTLLSGRVL